MPKHEPQTDSIGGGMKLFVNLLLHALFGLTWIAEVTLHIRIGVYYPSMQTRVASLILPFAWLFLWGQKVREQGYTDSLGPLAMLSTWLFWWSAFQWVVAILSRRTRTSNYTGFAWLNIPFFFLPEPFLKDFIEPALLCACGYWWYAANRPLMSFVFACGVAMFITGRIYALVDMHREQGYTDQLYRIHY